MDSRTERLMRRRRRLCNTRSHVADYFDSDGSRRKRPMTRKQAELFALCVETVQDYEDNVVDVLPDEVLLLVLSRMATCDLLPLRLVCRRWDELVLQPSVWCRRRLCFPRLALQDLGTANPLQVSFILYGAPAMDTVDLKVSCALVERPIIPALLRGKCKMRALRCSLTLKKACEDQLYDFFRRVQPTLQELNMELHSSGIGASEVLTNVLEILDDTPLVTLSLCEGSPGRGSGFLPPAQEFQFRKLKTLETLHLTDSLLGPDLQRCLIRLNQDSLRHVTCLPEVLPALANCPRLTEVTVSATKSLRYLHKLATLDTLTIRWTHPGQAVHIWDYLDGSVEGQKLPSELHLYMNHYNITTDMLVTVGDGLKKFTTLSVASGLGWKASLDFVTAMESLQVLRVPLRIYENWTDLRSSSLRKIELVGRGEISKVWLEELRARWPAVDITPVEQRPEFLRGFDYYEW